MISAEHQLDISTLKTLDGDWDVVVVGGGPSGCAAAVTAGEMGARTLVIERSCALGGMGTIARVPAWTPFSDKQQQIHQGFAGRMLKLSLESTPHIPQEKLDWVPISFEHLKVIYDEQVSQSGAKVRFDTLLVDVFVDDSGQVTGLVVADKTGLSVVKAPLFIDCTGDADLVARSGVPIHFSDDQGGELMPATMCFTLANVKGLEVGKHWPSLKADPSGKPSVIKRICEDERFAEIPDQHICMASTGPGCVSFNAGHIYDVDNTNPESISEAMAKGRKLASVYREALAAYLPQHFGESVLISTGAYLGVRETRRIYADYELTAADYLDRRSFEDEICRNAYFIDIHLYSDESGKSEDWEARVHSRVEKYRPGESHGVPYRSLCPKDLTNVLVAGRSIGADRTVNASIRVMPVCLCTGEAAGAAAALLTRDGTCNVHQVDPHQLRRVLKKRGVYLP